MYLVCVSKYALRLEWRSEGINYEYHQYYIMGWYYHLCPFNTEEVHDYGTYEDDGEYGASPLVQMDQYIFLERMV